MESALYYAENETDILSLACTNLTTEELSMLNFTVQWWERSAMSVETNEVPVNLSSSSSGFYCCQVLTGGGDPVLTVCATLVIVGMYNYALLRYSYVLYIQLQLSVWVQLSNVNVCIFTELESFPDPI